MENPLHYRNKAQYPVGINKENEPVVGIFAQRSHEIMPREKCLIQKPISEEIAKTILEFIKQNKISIYNEKTGKGLFRHIVIKVGAKTNEIMTLNAVENTALITVNTEPITPPKPFNTTSNIFSTIFFQSVFIPNWFLKFSSKNEDILYLALRLL